MREKLYSLKPRQLTTVRHYFYWAYAHLAMAESAVNLGNRSYSRYDRMQGYAAFNGLMRGERTIQVSLSDERNRQIHAERICNYCGKEVPLTLDHLLARSVGGPDHPENLVSVCKSCNSSKGSRDLLEWMGRRGHFLPLTIIKRYLKLSYASYEKRLEENVEKHTDLPKFPLGYPSPEFLSQFSLLNPRAIRPERARATIGPLKGNCRISLKTQASLIEFVHFILGTTGPAHLIFATDAVDELDLDHLLKHLSNQTLSTSWLLPTRFPSYCPRGFRRLVAEFGPDRVRCCKDGPRCTLIQNQQWNVGLFSTLDLAQNRGLASLEIVDDAEVLQQVMAQDFLPAWRTASAPASAIQNLRQAHGDQQTFDF